MDNTRLPKHALKYKLRGRGDRERPKKRWQCIDDGTVHKTYSMEEDDDDKKPRRFLKYKPTVKNLTRDRMLKKFLYKIFD